MFHRQEESRMTFHVREDCIESKTGWNSNTKAERKPSISSNCQSAIDPVWQGMQFKIEDAANAY